MDAQFSGSYQRTLFWRLTQSANLNSPKDTADNINQILQLDHTALEREISDCFSSKEIELCIHELIGSSGELISTLFYKLMVLQKSSNSEMPSPVVFTLRFLPSLLWRYVTIYHDEQEETEAELGKLEITLLMMTKLASDNFKKEIASGKLEFQIPDFDTGDLSNGNESLSSTFQVLTKGALQDKDPHHLQEYISKNIDSITDESLPHILGLLIHFYTNSIFDMTELSVGIFVDFLSMTVGSHVFVPRCPRLYVGDDSQTGVTCYNHTNTSERQDTQEAENESNLATRGYLKLDSALVLETLEALKTLRVAWPKFKEGCVQNLKLAQITALERVWPNVILYTHSLSAAFSDL